MSELKSPGAGEAFGKFRFSQTRRISRLGRRHNRRFGAVEFSMRNIVNVTNVIDIVRGVRRDLVVVVKANAAMCADSLRVLHLSMRHALSALAGSSLFKKQTLQPAYAAAYATPTALPATAGTGWREARVRPASRPSIRIG